jgi:hypothetical protein
MEGRVGSMKFTGAFASRLSDYLPNALRPKRWSRQPIARGGILASVCLLVGVIGLSARAGARGASVVYTGHISSDYTTRVKLKVNGNRATFDPGKVPLQCADGTAEEGNPGVVKVRLDSKGKFETYRSFADPHTGNQAFYFAEGQVVCRRRLNTGPPAPV